MNSAIHQRKPSDSLVLGILLLNQNFENRPYKAAGNSQEELGTQTMNYSRPS